MGSQEAFRRRVRLFQIKKAEQLEKRYRGVFYRKGQEIDIPPHRSAFISRGECHGRGIIDTIDYFDLSIYKVDTYLDKVLMRLLRQGKGLCGSCSAPFDWSHNYNTRMPDVTMR